MFNLKMPLVCVSILFAITSQCSNVAADNNVYVACFVKNLTHDGQRVNNVNDRNIEDADEKMHRI